MGFWAVQRLHFGAGLSLAAAVGVAALAGAAMALIHAFLVITLRASQIVSGLALTIFAGAAGLSSYLAQRPRTSPTNPARAPVPARSSRRACSDWPVVGPIVFGQNVLVYASWLCVVAVWLYLSRTRPGLNVRAVGESPAAADAMGIDVAAYRYAHTLVGGAFAGVAGATFTLAITPQWIDGITGGAGWIAIALVIFAFWRPELCLVGAYFFGALQALVAAAPGAGHPPRADRALGELAAVRDDDRRARARRRRAARAGGSARRRASACPTCARSAERSRSSTSPMRSTVTSGAGYCATSSASCA